MKPTGQHNNLWALTTYFNPMHYGRRLLNYRQFRVALNVPLITVELSGDDVFELKHDDAEMLIQIKGEPFLWQKERLLNIALQHVPEDVTLVSWLDCDVMFERDDWSDVAEELLQSLPVAQLFAGLYDLSKDQRPQDVVESSRAAATGTSIAKLMQEGQAVSRYFRPSTSEGVRAGLFGLAWAARREVLREHGFYDAMILGSGDRVMACAAYGRFEDAVYSTRLDVRRREHYLRWALPFFDTIRGRVGCVDGYLYHLWHGDILDRRYVDRHVRLAEMGFDPFTDLVATNSGCWRWSERRPDLKEFVRAYFAARNEDGTDVAATASWPS